MKLNLVPINQKKLLINAGIYISPSTLYKWHSRGKFKEIYCKVSGRLFINLDEFKRTFLESQES